MKLSTVRHAAKKIGRPDYYLRNRDYELSQLGILIRAVDPGRTRLYHLEALEAWAAEVRAAEVEP